MCSNVNMIKARVAEAIIKQLFIENNFQVFENGMERNRPEIMDKIVKKSSKVAKEIRFSPDFVVINPTNGDIFYLEVKYRYDGKFELKDIENYPYKNAHFIIVSKKDIQWITYSKLNEIKKLSGDENFKIEKSDLFKLNKESVARYKKYIEAFFCNIDQI